MRNSGDSDYVLHDGAHEMSTNIISFPSNGNEVGDGTSTYRQKQSYARALTSYFKKENLDSSFSLLPSSTPNSTSSKDRNDNTVINEDTTKSESRKFSFVSDVDEQASSVGTTCVCNYPV